MGCGTACPECRHSRQRTVPITGQIDSVKSPVGVARQVPTSPVLTSLV
jgi:hypothetical protein